MKAIILAVGTLALASCASFEQPYAINGQCYSVSQKMCQRVEATSPTSIICYNAKGKAFYRQAMTQYELAQYGAMMQGMSNNIAAGNAVLAAQVQAITANVSSYTPPEVTPLTTTATSFAHCRNHCNQFSRSSRLPQVNFSCSKTDTLLYADAGKIHKVSAAAIRGAPITF